MLNLLTLHITNKEILKEYNERRTKRFYEFAEYALAAGFVMLGFLALNIWVFE